MRRRHFISGVLLCLLLGVITTVAIAWGLVLTQALGVVQTTTVLNFSGNSNGYYWSGTQLSNTGYMFIISSRDKYRMDTNYSGNATSGQVIPEWTGFDIEAEAFRSGAVTGEHRYADVRGWPYLCLWTEYGLQSYKKPQEFDIHYGFQLGDYSHKFGPRVLPLRPFVSGFAINTLFYAAIWFILIYGSIAIHRVIRKKAIRIRHGKCPQCAYDLRSEFDTGCPECGWNRGETSKRPNIETSK